MEVALQLVTHNSSAFLPFLFESLKAQTDMDWRLWILDCGSSEAERVLVRELVCALLCDLSVEYEEGENIGFAGGHDLLFHKHHAPAVLLVNPDVILMPEYIATIREALSAHPRVGAVTGRINRWEFDEHRQPRFLEAIDSFGLLRTRSHKVYDRTTLDDRPAFGVSGCLPFYRRAAIEQSSHDGHLFDPTYFMYKEDVDVAYRLHRALWQTLCLPKAVAYHHRDFRASALHYGVSVQAQQLSYRNHWLNLLTHLSFKDWLRDGIAIIPFELAKAAYLLVTHPSILFKTLRELISYE